MTPLFPPPALLLSFAFVFGAIVGSFLNVVIYRLPLDLSVNEPRRSFCPHCKKPIPFYRNIPLFSWLALRGKCADCGAGIPIRYFIVELLTGLLFLGAAYEALGSGVWAAFFPLALLFSLLVAATFIDFDHFIIPDEITLGGTAAGVVCSLLVPEMVGETVFWKGALWSLIGAGIGWVLLWTVAEAGKLAFGRKSHTYTPAAPFTWTRHGDDADLVINGETSRWSEIFPGERDQLLLDTVETTVDNEPVEAPQLRFFYNRLLLPSKEYLLDTVDVISGKVSRITIPRDAMGFGDVKFIACIGAFLGWRAVLFTVVAASVFGSLAGVALMLTGRRDASGRIPFGPYLALGALCWVFFGPEVVAWYWQWLTPPEAAPVFQ